MGGGARMTHATRITGSAEWSFPRSQSLLNASVSESRSHQTLQEIDSFLQSPHSLPGWPTGNGLPTPMQYCPPLRFPFLRHACLPITILLIWSRIQEKRKVTGNVISIVKKSNWSWRLQPIMSASGVRDSRVPGCDFWYRLPDRVSLVRNRRSCRREVIRMF